MDTETCPNFLHYGTNDTRKMGKKKIVITLSRVFPTTHSRKGQPTDFKEWFFGRHPQEDKVFHGVIIHFTDFRY